jgi:hypothetical protein
MDDTNSLPTTNTINLSYDRSTIFLVFFYEKKTDQQGKKKKKRHAKK